MTKETVSEIFGRKPPNVVEFTREVPCSNPDLVLGMEIETENCRDSYLGAVARLNWNTTTDGSLRGSAFEYVSVPMKMKHLLASVEEFFKVTRFTEANYTDRCSIHVHVNCTNLTIDQLATFALVYSIFEEPLFDFVGGHRDTNIYCIPWNQCRFNNKLITKFREHISSTARNWQKYTAVNLLPLATQGTVEFRHMHGTANVEKITQWVNLIGCLFKYSTDKDFAQVYEAIKSINSVSNYEQYFYEVFGQYFHYSEEIHRKLEAGVICAKYALINYDPNAKPVEQKKKSKDVLSSYAEMITEEEFTIQVNGQTANEILAGLRPVNVQPPQTRRNLQGHHIPVRRAMSRAEYMGMYGIEVLTEWDRRSSNLERLGLTMTDENVNTQGLRV